MVFYAKCNGIFSIINYIRDVLFIQNKYKSDIWKKRKNRLNFRKTLIVN